MHNMSKSIIKGGDCNSTVKENVSSWSAFPFVPASSPSSAPFRYNLRPLANRLMRGSVNTASGHFNPECIDRGAQYVSCQSPELSYVKGDTSGQQLNVSILLGPADDNTPKPFIRPIESPGYLHQPENISRRGNTRVIESFGHTENQISVAGGKKQEQHAKPVLQEEPKESSTYESDEIYAAVRQMKERKLSSIVEESDSTKATDGHATASSELSVKQNENQKDELTKNWTPVIDCLILRKPTFLVDLLGERPAEADSNQDKDAKNGQVIESQKNGALDSALSTECAIGSSKSKATSSVSAADSPLIDIGKTETASSSTSASSSNAASKDIINRATDESLNSVPGDDVIVLIKNKTKNWGFLPWSNLPFSRKKNNMYQKIIEVILELQALYDVSEKLYITAEKEWFMKSRVPKRYYHKAASKLEELKLFTSVFEGLWAEMMDFLKEGRITIKINHASQPLDTLWKRAASASSVTAESSLIIKLTKVYLTNLRADTFDMRRRYNILVALACPAELPIVMTYRSLCQPAIRRILEDVSERINYFNEPDWDVEEIEDESGSSESFEC